MKKTFKLSALALISLIFPIFTIACDSSEAQSTEKELNYDFSSEEIIIVCDENNSDDFLYFSYDSVEAEELLRRKSEIEEKYGCKITVSNVENDVESFVSSKIASNSKSDIDIIMAFSYYIRRWAGAGYLYDIADYSDIIDYTDSFRWGTKNDLEALAVNGKIYGLLPACFPDNLRSFFYVITTNNQLMKDAGYGDMSVYQEEGTWSREKFEEFIANCSQIDKGIYSLDTGLESFLTTCIYSGGGTIYDSDTGKSGLNNQGVTDSLAWGKGILENYSQQIYLHDDFRDMFLTGYAAMATADSSSITETISKNENIGEFSVLPFPKSENANENTATGYIHSYKHILAIPKIAGDIEASAVVISELFKPLSTMSNSEAIRQYYKQNVFWSDKDVEILFEESEKAEYSYWQEGFHNVLTTIANSTMSSTPAAAIQSSIPTAEHIIENTIKENKEGVELYFE